MERITGNSAKSLLESYQKIYSSEESVEQLNEGIRDVLPSWAGGKTDAEKETDRRAAELRRTSEREKKDTAAGRAFSNPATGMRYTRPTPNTTRQEGQVATLGGKKVQWSVDKAGKGSWVPYETEGEMARRINRERAAKEKTSGTSPTSQQTTLADKTKTTSSTDQQKVRAEYDRLRKLNPKTGKVEGSPEDLKKAAEYGKKMAAAGAAKKDFKMPTSTSTSTPTATAKPVSAKPSIAQQLQDIRRMKIASQMRQNNINVTSGQLKSAENRKPSSSAVRSESLDVFDIVKSHFIDEGLSESEVLEKMINMTEDEIRNVVEKFPDVKGTLNPWESPKTGKSGVKYVVGPGGQPKQIKNPLYKGV